MFFFETEWHDSAATVRHRAEVGIYKRKIERKLDLDHESDQENDQEKIKFSFFSWDRITRPETPNRYIVGFILLTYPGWFRKILTSSSLSISLGFSSFKDSSELSRRFCFGFHLTGQKFVYPVRMISEDILSLYAKHNSLWNADIRIFATHIPAMRTVELVACPMMSSRSMRLVVSRIIVHSLAWLPHALSTG